MTNELIALADRATTYLAHGGLFNPELAEHGAVRDLILDCRDMLREMLEQEPVAWLHTVKQQGGDETEDHALSFSPNNFPLQGTAPGMFYSISHAPLYALPVAQPSFNWQKSCHYTAENIAAMIADLRAVEKGTESIEWMNRDHRTKAGILWRVILALSHDVPVAQPSKEPAPGYCPHCKQYTIAEPLPAKPSQEWLDEAMRLADEYATCNAIYQMTGRLPGDQYDDMKDSRAALREHLEKRQ